MKILRCSLIDEKVDITNGGLLTFVIENKALLYRICSFCQNDFKGDEDFLSLEDSKTEKALPIDFVPNPFALDLNTKRNITSLYKVLKANNKELLQERLGPIQESMVRMLSDISLDFVSELDFNDEIAPEDLFKAMDLKFKESEGSLLERVLEYIKVTSELTGTSCFVFYGLKDFLEQTQIDLLISELALCHLSIIDLEAKESGKRFDNERLFVIDKDLCLL